jgi:hypothetical protein
MRSEMVKGEWIEMERGKSGSRWVKTEIGSCLFMYDIQHCFI